MNEQRIQELLRKYFDGATSLAEEHELRRFFAEEEIPDSLKVYCPMFDFFAEERAVEFPATKRSEKTRRMSWVVTVSIAASVAVLMLIGLPRMFGNDYMYYVDGKRIYDKAAAMESAEEKLQSLISSMQKAQEGMSAFNMVKESNQSLRQLDKIQDAYHQTEKVLSGAKPGEAASGQPSDTFRNIENTPIEN